MPPRASELMVTPGINDAAVAAAAIVVDGELPTARAEERLTQREHLLRVPLHTLVMLPTTEGLTINDIDQIAAGSVGGLVPTMDAAPMPPSTPPIFGVSDTAWHIPGSIKGRRPARQAFTAR